jgi:hypothetical protein
VEIRAALGDVRLSLTGHVPHGRLGGCVETPRGSGEARSATGLRIRLFR